MATLTLSSILTKAPYQESPAVIIPSKQSSTIVSYSELQGHVQTFQKCLAETGIGAKSAVSIAIPNSVEFLVAFLATTWQRAIAAPLNPAYKQEENEFYIKDLDSDAIIVPRGAYEKQIPAVLAARKFQAAIIETGWEDGKVSFVIREEGKLAKRDQEECLTAETNDVALVLHTSGTTGRPKAVPLSHGNLLVNIDNICKTYQLTATDRTMLIMPLFHVHGLLASFFSPLYSGGAAIIPTRLSPSFWKDFAENKATWYSATPTMHRLILQFQFPADGVKPRFIRSCSSPMSPKLFEQVEKAFGAPVLEAYAMTEASHQIASNPLPPATRRPGCVGIPQGVQVKIMNDETEVALGQEGEVCIRGRNVTAGYLNNPEANSSAFTSDHFFRTGDQGKFDEDGYLTLTGRIKEFINKGGEKISPVEIDNLVTQHPALSEVVTFAIDDDMYGQDVGVVVKLKDGEKVEVVALKKWIRERISAMKVPKHIWLTEEIPKTGTGKVQRRLVADTMAKQTPL